MRCRASAIVVYEISQQDYDELVVIPMLVSKSTHTDEITDQIEEFVHLIEGVEVTIWNRFLKCPYMRDSLGDAVVSWLTSNREQLPGEVQDHNIGMLLASHGTPYVPPFPEFGWKEGDIYSELIPTEDAFHEDVGRKLPWAAKTGRMKYSSPHHRGCIELILKRRASHMLS